MSFLLFQATPLLHLAQEGQGAMQRGCDTIFALRHAPKRRLFFDLSWLSAASLCQVSFWGQYGER